MRRIPDNLDPDVVTRIDDRLTGVEAEHDVVIGWAAESGSRAWGFPSPDSDYDCRFLYLRPAHGYLTPWLPRDVVETPLDHVYDVNGWDLRKAVALMVRGNATVVEWLGSPIVYRGDPAFRELLLDLADRIGEPALIARHYTHLGRLQWERLGAQDPAAEVKLKGLFYSLRPAAALRWMRIHPGRSVPPMRLQDLLTAGEAPAALMDAVTDLVALKAGTRELGTGAVPSAVRAFVVAELTAPPTGSGERRVDVHRARAIAAEAFRSAIARFT
jgi:predicted nucleotidyltransferase